MTSDNMPNQTPDISLNDKSASKTLCQALLYAKFGYKVLPLRKNEKAPDTLHGVKDATTDENAIKDWFTGTDHNIGLSCDGLFVIDCDTYKDESLKKWEGMLADENIPIQKTPQGGTHFLFKRPDNCDWKNSANKIEKGVDTRTDGGYIAVYPSIVDGKEYQWSR